MKILKSHLEEKSLSGYGRRFKSLVKLEKLSQDLVLEAFNKDVNE